MIIIRIWEGLGNQMFQYAFAKSLELKTKQKVYIDISSSFRNSLGINESEIKRPYALDVFKTTIPSIQPENYKEWSFINQQNFFQKLKFSLSQKGKYHHHFIFDSYDVTEFHDNYYKVSDNTYFMGWFQNEMYFKDIREVILKEFKIDTEDKLNDVIPQGNSVSIHIRRGDFVKGNWCVPEEYYYKAMRYIQRKVDNPQFICFTDDILWATSFFKNEKNICFAKELAQMSDQEELVLMSKCKHNIIANSTYSWWGAWLNENREKIVVSPKEWTPRQQNINPSKWIEL